MAKTTRKTSVSAPAKAAKRPVAAAKAAPAKAAPKSSTPERTIAGVIVGIVAQRLLSAAVRRLIRRLR